MIQNIVGDKREIESISVGVGEDSGFYSTKFSFDYKIDSIKPYYEDGEMAGVIWFALYRGDTIICRINGKFVSVILYKEVATDIGEKK